MRTLLFCLVAIGSVFGQPNFFPTPRFPEALREYLALTEAQISKISEQNGAFAQWSAGRWQRMFEVQIEIAGETAREPLDPGALGVRYAEVEAIRREIVERERKTLAENVAVLTPAQALKLKALEEALKLVSTGSEAQFMGLLPNSCSSSLAQPSIPTAVIRDPIPGFSFASLCTARVGFFGFSSAPNVNGSVAEAAVSGR
ncbi:MAG: hypothetical protein ACKV2U_24625 [Bryobacteraceae bacterium]